MNIAAGVPLERNKLASDIRPKDYLSKLMNERFSGYIAITIKGKYGLEEGTIVFHNGDIVSSDYEYYKFDKAMKAEEGLERSLNALCSATGVIDSFSLTSYQVQLVLTLNEEANLKEKLVREKMKLPESFSYEYENRLSTELPKDEISRDQLFRKLGLSQTIAEDTTREELLNTSRRESQLLEEFYSKKAERKR